MTRSLWVNRAPYARNIRRISREISASFGRLGIRDYLVELEVHIVEPRPDCPLKDVVYGIRMRLRRTPTGPDCHVRRWITRLDRGFYSYGRKYRWAIHSEEPTGECVTRSVGTTLKSMIALCRDAATGAL